MIIKLKKINAKPLLCILLILFLSLFTINEQQLRTAKQDVIQYLLAMNLGFSYQMNLVDKGDGLFQLASEAGGIAYRKSILPSIFGSIPKIINYKISGDNFERIDIDIKYLDYQKLMVDRDRAIETGLMSDHTVIEGEIKFKALTYKTELRLKGDRDDHWRSKYRMSLRVKIKGKRTLLGYKKFSLMKPGSRYHPYDYTFQSMMRGVGNLSSVQKFVHLYVNGADWGIMAMEEHISKEFLEKLKRKESVVVRFSNERSWKYTDSSQSPYSKYRISDPSLNVHLYGGKKHLQNDQYRKMYSYILKHSINYAPYLYDTDSFTKSYILATAWANWHTLLDYNSKYYLNPYTLTLEPITTDQLEYLVLDGIKSISHPNLPRQYASIMSTQSYINGLSDNLYAVSNVVSKTKQYLNDANQFFPVDRKKNGEVVLKNMSKIISEKNKYLIFPEKIPSEGTKAEILPTINQASEFEEHLHIRHYTDGRLEFYNLLPDDVTVIDILFDDRSLFADKFTVPSYLSSSSPITLRTTYVGIQDNRITIKTEYKGFIRQVKSQITLFSNDIENPLLLNTSPNTLFLKKLKNGSYEFLRGNWVINEPLIINGDLHIPPGVNMQFSQNAYLIIKGALTAVGDKNAPIVFQSLLKSWKGIYVLKASKRSHLSNVIIRNIEALEDGLLKLSGGVTFYRSDVDLKNITVENVKAEDAINLVESAFTMNFVKITHTASDGLDSDYSQGTIFNSTFSDIGGDALDFSGSSVEVNKIKITNVKDKAISGGEKSNISIKNSTFSGIGVGIASKDGSKVSADNTTISNYRLHAAMSYMKKDFYLAPILEIVDCNIDPGNPYARQTGTTMIVNNSEIPEVELNVKKLYQSEVMKK